MKKRRSFNFRKKFVTASFFIALITFVLLHYYLPEKKEGFAWLAFLIVPLAPVITGLKKVSISYSLIVVILYLVLGFACNWWHPGWILFLTIPVFYIFFPRGVGRFIKITTDDDDDIDYDEL